MIGVVYLVVGAVLLLLALAFAVIAKRDMLVTPLLGANSPNYAHIRCH